MCVNYSMSQMFCAYFVVFGLINLWVNRAVTLNENCFIKKETVMHLPLLGPGAKPCKTEAAPSSALTVTK